MSAPTPASSFYREWTFWVLQQPLLHSAGIQVEWQGKRHDIGWSEIARAFAAEVGEPEGIRAVVFDLAWPAAPECPAILRFSVDPCDGPKRPAQLFLDSLGVASCSNSLRSLATDGRATDLYSHIDLLDEALVTSLVAIR